jgi:hypothetical protein
MFDPLSMPCVGHVDPTISCLNDCRVRKLLAGLIQVFKDLNRFP